MDTRFYLIKFANFISEIQKILRNKFKQLFGVFFSPNNEKDVKNTIIVQSDKRNLEAVPECFLKVETGKKSN